MNSTRYQFLMQVRAELEVAKASIQYLEQEWAHLELDPRFRNLNLQKSAFRQTASNLELTYIIRLFSAFEAILREALPQRSPFQTDRRNVYDLINRCASRHRISSVVRDTAHQVREYRNQTVHQSSAGLPPLVFADAFATLNRFLSWLPDS